VDRDGATRWERRYSANRPHGSWKYFVGDRLAFEMTYRDGLLHGPAIEYDETGNPIAVHEYRDGEWVGTEPAASETADD
ncbi:MAG: hypothetical protein H0V89_03375, partial [Deltaproteobacteria bacterium]|nr:hypothetical protein [Deltaproteobacteria bacterium]